MAQAVLQPCLQLSLPVLAHLATVPAPEDTGDVRAALAHACISHDVGGQCPVGTGSFSSRLQGADAAAPPQGVLEVFLQVLLEKRRKNPSIFIIFTAGRDVALPG